MVSILAWVGACAVTATVSAEPSPGATASLRSELRAAMQATLPSQGAIDDGEARELLSLYQRLEADKSIAERERERLLNGLKRRLVSAAEQAHQRAERGEQRPETVALPDDAAPILAQQQPLPPAPQAPANPPAPNAAQDSGDELARLIVATIAPETWEQNGGEGSIYYYQQWQCLVVRQTDDIHRRLGRLVVDLRQP